MENYLQLEKDLSAEEREAMLRYYDALASLGETLALGITFGKDDEGKPLTVFASERRLLVVH